MTRLSVVTVAYNSERTIARTIESVLSQKFVDVEYVIVDGSSKDRTMEIVRSYGKRISRVISEPDRGLYDAMNKGWQVATGDVIGFLNSDDRLAHSEVLSRIAAVFDEEQAVDAVYADLDLVNKADQVVRRWKSGAFSRFKYHWGWMTPHPTTYIRKELFLQYGGFRDTDLKIAADYELMLRFFYKYKRQVRYLPETIVRMEAGGASNGSLYSIYKANREVWRSWLLNDLKTSPTIMITKPLSKILQLRI